MPSFDNVKALRFEITLGTAKFAGSSNNQTTFQGLRATVSINNAGGSQMSEMTAQIYGVSQSDMNSITTLQYKLNTVLPNTIQVFAIDGAQESLVFQGNIINAWGNYQSQPDVFLEIRAQTVYFSRLIPVPPRSFPGPVDVATVMARLAESMQLAFENNGVNVTLGETYLDNTNLEQAKDLALAANVDMYIGNGILAITPAGMPRGSLIPEVSPQSGLQGYPTFDGVGVNFDCLFNPAIVFGGRVKLTTSLPNANGTWGVQSMVLNLQSETPNGRWSMSIRGVTLGLVISK